MIRRLFPGQPAASSGKLRIGDIIASVNNTPLDGFSQHEAIALLRNEQSLVRLVINRPSPSDIPEVLLAETPREKLDPHAVLGNIQRKLSEKGQ